MRERKILRNTEKRVLLILCITAVLSGLIFAWKTYENDYYRATDTVKKAMLGNENVEVRETEDYYVFTPISQADIQKGMVFYAGGKVEETAYAPMLLKFAENGYEVYLIKMPAKLAIFGVNSAKQVFEDAPYIENWTMMGHSLGGAMAASFSAENDDKVDALVLLAAYSTKDLNELDMQVYSFYGTEDMVLNREKYASYHENLPEGTIEEVIEGGNHANFGYYGTQEGDGTASITRKEQQECVIDIFLSGEKDVRD